MRRMLEIGFTLRRHSRLRMNARAFLAGLAFLTAMAPTACRADDLLDIFNLARRADPVLASADAARGIAGETVVQSRAALLPQVSAGVSLNETRDPGAPTNDPSSVSRNRTRATTASLSQVVLDLARLSQWRGSQAQADAQAAVYRAAEQALVVRVASAYFGALTAADAVATALANENAFRLQVDQSETRYRNGLSAAVDVDQARSFHAAARATTVAARTALADAREALTELTGTEPGTLKTLRQELPITPPSPADPQAWVATALRDNPLLQAQQFLVDAAEQSIATARAGRLPTVTAGVDVGRGAGWPQPASNADGRTVTTVGLVLRVPLFAGGAIQSQIRSAALERNRAGDELERQRRQVGRDTLDRYRNVVAGVEQIAATREAFEAARKAYESTRVGRELGTQSMTDLLFSITNLASAQGRYSEVRHQYVLNRLLLAQAAGNVTETDLLAVNALLQ